MEPRGLALISPFASMREVAVANMRWLPVELLMRDRYDNAAKLPEVAAPVLILHGAHDTLIPLEHAVRLSRRGRSVTFEVVPGVGHELVALDIAPRLLLEWLDALRGSEPAAQAGRNPA